MRNGLFIVLEGVEGAGKSTQARLLSEWFERLGLPYTLAREPGGTPVGEAIRRVVLDRGELTMPSETELFLILGARAAFVRDVVRPALEAGQVVLADRFDLSTFAYQGYGRGLDLEQVKQANEMATGGLSPDLYLVLDLPVEVGLERKGGVGAGDRIEREGVSFLTRVREGYRTLAETVPTAWLIAAHGSSEEVHSSIRGALAEAFPETFSVKRV
ncbi:MAG: dTMP kinase [Gemmatimonadota bacterium]